VLVSVLIFFSLSAIETNERTNSGASSSEAKPSVKIGEDGYPILPVLDGESITPKLARELLKDFISVAWGTFSSLLIVSLWTSSGTPNISLDLAIHNLGSEAIGIPWDAMSLPHRLMYTAPDSLLSFPDLDPMKMSREVTYSFFEAVLASQLKQECLIKFSITENALFKLQQGDEAWDQRVDDEIIEIDDPPKSPSKSHNRSPQKAKLKSPANNFQELIDFSPPFRSVTSDMDQSDELTPPAVVLSVTASITGAPTSMVPTAMDLSSLSPSLTLVPFAAASIAAASTTTVPTAMDPLFSIPPGDTSFMKARLPKKAGTKAKQKTASVKATSNAMVTADEGSNTRKRKSDEGDVAPARKKQKALGPAFSPRKPSAR